MSVFISDYSIVSPHGLGTSVVLSAIQDARPPSIKSDRPIFEWDAQSAVEGVEFDRTQLMLRSLCDIVDIEREVDRGRAGVFVGSARGATRLLEESISSHQSGRRLGARVSPRTTMGGLSAVVAEGLGLRGPHMAISSACTSSMHAVYQGYAQIKSGCLSSAVVGGVDAPTTEFCIGMFNSLRLCTSNLESPFPIRPFGIDRDGIVLADGAGLLALSANRSDLRIQGIGVASEAVSDTGLSKSGKGLQSALEYCFADAGCSPADVDFVVGHGAGTRKGDAAELEAYRSVFGGGAMPPVVAHKWATGHSLGAAGALSLALACEHLRQESIPEFPYETMGAIFRQPEHYRRALVCSLGFGGGAAAVLVERMS